LAPMAEPNANSYPAQVVGHVFRGTHHAYQVRLDGERRDIFVYEQAQGREGRPVLAPGDRTWLCWAPEDSILVEPDHAAASD
jgi:hypothetical protein